MNRTAGLRLAGITFGATAAVLALNLVGSILLARFLGPEGRGALTALLFWPHLFAGLGNLSINEALVKQIASSPRTAHERLLRVSLALTVALGFVTVVVGVILTPALLGPARAALVDITRWYFVLFVPVSIAALCLLAYQQGALNFGRFNQLRLLQSGSYVGALVVLAVFGIVSVQSVTIVTLLSTLFAAVVSWFWAQRPIPGWDRAIASDLTVLGAKYHGVNLLVFLANEIDKLVVLRWTGDHDVGLYAVATAVAMLGSGLIGQTASAVLFPKIAGMADETQRRQLFCSSTRLIVGLTITMNGALALTVPFLVPLVFGAAFEPAIPVTQVLLLAHSIKAIRGVIDRSMRATGIVSGGFFAEAATSVAFLATASLCFGAYGLLGVAGALAIGQSIGLVVLGYTVRSRLGLRPREWLPPRLPNLRELRDSIKRMPPK